MVRQANAWIYCRQNEPLWMFISGPSPVKLPQISCSGNGPIGIVTTIFKPNTLTQCLKREQMDEQ